MTRRTAKSSRKRLDKQLQKLAAAELLHRAEDDEPAYIFKNTLTQATAYGSLLNTRRRELHRRVAEAYAFCYADRLDDYVPLLAYHYAQAGDDDRTLEYSIQAGDRALRLYANGEAITHYDRALGIAKKQTDNTPALVNLYTRRGRACELRGDYASALGTYGEMYVLARTRADRAFELQALLLLATAYAIGGHVANPQQAAWICDEALALARELGDRQAQARTLWNLMLLHRFHGQGPAKSIEYGEAALVLARELSLDELRGFILNDLGLSYSLVGQFDRAAAIAGEARMLWRARDNKPMLSSALAGSAMVSLLRGDFNQAQAQGEEALAIDESIDNLWGKSSTGWMLGMTYREAGWINRALPLLLEAIHIAEELGIFDALWAMQGELAWTYLVLGDLDRAWALTEWLLAQPAGQRADHRGWPLALQAQICLRRGQLEEAEARGASLGPPSTQVQAVQFGGVTAGTSMSVLQMELALARGEVELVGELAEQIAHNLERSGICLLACEARHVQGRALLAAERPAEAAAVLQEARAQALGAGARLRLWPILQTLARAEAACGNAAEARAARQEAEVTVTYIADHIDAPDLRQRFLDLTGAPAYASRG